MNSKIEQSDFVVQGVYSIGEHQQYRLMLEATRPGPIIADSQPGQFVTIGIPGKILRRPFSISRVDPRQGQVEFLFQRVGEGTAFLSELRPGHQLNLFGPLGNGFRIERAEHHIFVAGGMGFAPLIFLERRVVAAFPKNPGRTHLLFGIRTEDCRIIESVVGAFFGMHVSTDDGSYGLHGTATDLLRYFLQNWQDDPNPNLQIYACGPWPMLAGVAELAADHNIFCQVCLEKVMACGVGACHGCTIPTTKGNKTVCHDGPVFDSKTILWKGESR